LEREGIKCNLEKTQIFDRKNNAVNAIFTFVEEAMEVGECCLIHSIHGKSRACAVLFAYLLKKYNWSLNKALEFIHSKKDGL
jgi:protein-tyrosine phosphatase